MISCFLRELFMKNHGERVHPTSLYKCEGSDHILNPADSGSLIFFGSWHRSVRRTTFTAASLFAGVLQHLPVGFVSARWLARAQLRGSCRAHLCTTGPATSHQQTNIATSIVWSSWKMTAKVKGLASQHTVKAPAGCCLPACKHEQYYDCVPLTER